MANVHNTRVNARIPHQKRSTSSKGKKFVKDTFEGYLAMSASNDTSVNIRQSKYNMMINYNLANDILDEGDVESTVNPWDIRGATFPAKMQNYPIANPKIDLLIGEELKRRFDWKVIVTNSEAVSEKEDMIRQRMNELIIEGLTEENYDEREFEQQVAKLDKWSKYEAQDLRERRATHYLSYLWRDQNLKEKFNRGFYDALIAGEEIYCIDVVNDRPVVRKCDPLSISVIGLSDSPFIEDADAILEDVYQPIGQVIDNYYQYLSESDINYLERQYTSNAGESNLLNYDPSNIPPPSNPSTIAAPSYDEDSDEWDYSIINLHDYQTQNIAAFDEEGNVRVARLVWRSLRKVGELKWYDPDDGYMRKKLVDENYEPDEELGEEVEWFWINEWWECTRIAEDIYIKWGPRPIQFRRMDNRSLGGSGYVGTVYNINTSQAKSLMDRMKPYQYLYNVFMYRTELAFAKAKGKIGILNSSMIPDGWDMDKWLYYAEVMGWAVEDPFNEGQEGAATGKIAGTMNQNSRNIDLELGNYIQQHVMMLQFIEQQIGEIAGVTKQREGQIENRETVGGVERSVMQSSHITEKWFSVHDNTKVRVLETLLETAKYAWRNKEHERLQYITDEMSSVISEIDGEMFAEADHGIMISNSFNDAKLLNVLEQLAHAGIQTDKLNFSQLMDIYFSESMSSMRRKIEQSEQEAVERAEEARKQELEVQRQKIQSDAQSKAEDRRVKEEDSIRDNMTKLQTAMLQHEGDQQEEEDAKITLEKLKQEWQKIQNDWEIKNRELKEEERSNKAQEQLEKEKIKVDKKKTTTTKSSK